jgi:hypothetical protein
MSAVSGIRIDSVRKVFDDGDHNAFTDLCRYRGRIYLTFRSCPDGHMVFASSRIIVLVSDDGLDWEQVVQFSVPQRDPRDPHFLVLGQRLFVYTGTWLVPPGDAPRDLNDHLGYAISTTDGSSWEGPVMLEGTYGHYIWRAAARDGRAYLCGRRRLNFAAGWEAESNAEIIQGAMLESDDGIVWRHSALFTREHGDETAFLIATDGALLALARGTQGCPARICRSTPPYDTWTRTPLDRNVGGPLLARWGDAILVGGRRTVEPEGPRTALSWLVDDGLVDVAELPSSGDNSYPGFVELDASRALLSYYSSHEETTSIYLAELSLS